MNENTDKDKVEVLSDRYNFDLSGDLNIRFRKLIADSANGGRIQSALIREAIKLLLEKRGY